MEGGRDVADAGYTRARLLVRSIVTAVAAYERQTLTQLPRVQPNSSWTRSLFQCLARQVKPQPRLQRPVHYRKRRQCPQRSRRLSDVFEPPGDAEAHGKPR